MSPFSDFWSNSITWSRFCFLKTKLFHMEISIIMLSFRFSPKVGKPSTDDWEWWCNFDDYGCTKVHSALEMDLWLIEQTNKKKEFLASAYLWVMLEGNLLGKKLETRLPASNGPWLVILNHLKRRTQAELLVPPNHWYKLSGRRNYRNLLAY